MRHLLGGLLCLLLLGGCVGVMEEDSGKRYPDVMVSRLIRVYDGDTFICDIDELSPLIGRNIRVRLKNWNIPLDPPSIALIPETEKCKTENPTDWPGFPLLN